MPRDGSGNFDLVTPTYTGRDVWQKEESGGFNIEADRHDHCDNDIANEITNSLPRDGQAAPTANIPLGGFRFLNAGDAAANDQFVTLGQYTNNQVTWCGTSTGAGNEYQLLPAIPPAALAAGQRWQFIADKTNTAVPTVKVGSLDAKEVRGLTGTDVANGSLVQGALYEVIYQGNYYVLVQTAAINALSWTPTLGVKDGIGSISDVVVNDASYIPLGSWCILQLGASFTTAGGVTGVTFTAPMVIDNTAVGVCYAPFNSSLVEMGFCTRDDSLRFAAYAADRGVWDNRPSGLQAQVTYRCI